MNKLNILMVATLACVAVPAFAMHRAIIAGGVLGGSIIGYAQYKSHQENQENIREKKIDELYKSAQSFDVAFAAAKASLASPIQYKVLVHDKYGQLSCGILTEKEMKTLKSAVIIGIADPYDIADFYDEDADWCEWCEDALGNIMHSRKKQ